MNVGELIIKKRVSRSKGGDVVLLLFLLLVGALMLLPMVYAVSSSVKPNSELWLFPPRFFAKHPTGRNYRDLLTLLSTSWVPFSRYVFNTVFITAAGTAGHILIASMCAYPLAMYRFPGSGAFFTLVRTSLMFSGAVTAIPGFIVVSRLHLLDTYAAVILPAIGGTLGLFLMKQFMEQTVHPAVLESASMDGASEYCKFVHIVMPMVKPAWLTLMIFSVQTLWNTGSTPYIYSEQRKTLSYAMSQISAAGVARAGVGAAVSVLMMLMPLLVFIVTQSNIIEPMGSSGMKD